MKTITQKPVHHFSTRILFYLSYFLLVITSPVRAQSDNPNPISRFALSFNPLGFVQFGPLGGIEFGLSRNMVLNLHARMPSLGVLNYIINADEDGLNELTGFAAGGGPVYFIGNKVHKPYAGILFEYEKLHLRYAQEEPWKWEESADAVIFIANGGYRFRFKSGFFVNTGIYLGASAGWYECEFDDKSYEEFETESLTGTEIVPFGMFEVALGFEF